MITRTILGRSVDESDSRALRRDWMLWGLTQQLRGGSRATTPIELHRLSLLAGVPEPEFQDAADGLVGEGFVEHVDGGYRITEKYLLSHERRLADIEARLVALEE